MHVIEREQFFPRPRPEVFAFFADASNLTAITPPFLHFKILTPMPLSMEEGTLLDYRLRLYGCPVRWRTRIEEFETNVRFVDMALRSPYRRWHHTHTFEDQDGGTRMRDRVEYALPFGPLGTFARTLVVKKTLEAIFDYRRDVMAQRFGSKASWCARS